MSGYEDYGMANIGSRVTGLDGVWSYISPRNKARHGPRVKVSNSAARFDADDNFSLSVSEMPELQAGVCKLDAFQLAKVKHWITTNRDLLLAYWNGYILDTGDIIDALRERRGS